MSSKCEFGAICLQECTFCDSDDLIQTELKGYTLIPRVLARDLSICLLDTLKFLNLL